MWKNKNTIIVLNWKMNPPDLNDALRIFDFVREEAKNSSATIVLCPPFIYLNAMSVKLSEKTKNAGKIKIGAQNCFWETRGAYTGEVSPVMLHNMNCEYVILGHSERRINLYETDEMINKKIKAALNAGLKVIFCVGEHKRDENKNYLNFLKNQIKSGLSGLSPQDFKNIIVAYEPIWAISSVENSKADNPEILPLILDLIKKTILSLFSEEKNFDITILYGGSVNSANFKEFLKVDDLAGFLIGSASLNQNELKQILENF